VIFWLFFLWRIFSGILILGFLGFWRFGTELVVDACWEQSLIAGEEFQHILRVLNTNVDGRQKIMFALTSIKGVGRRFANLVCKKADVDMSKRCVWRHDCFFSPLHSRDMMEVPERSWWWLGFRNGDI
jgi:hypothetical protein